MQALRNTIKNSGLSNPELSLKLGHSRKYLTNLLNDGCSTELQNRLIEEINQVMVGTFKTDAEVIAELTEKLSDAQDQKIELGKHWENSFNHQKRVAQAEIEKLHKANIKLIEESDEYHTKNQTLRKNAQNHDIAISEHQATITHLTAQLNQSRETMSKQNTLNEWLNTECDELAEKLGFKTKEWVELTEQLDIKNHGEIIMNQTIHKLRKSEMYHRIFAFICLAVIVLLSVIKWGV